MTELRDIEKDENMGNLQELIKKVFPDRGYLLIIFEDNELGTNCISGSNVSRSRLKTCLSKLFETWN